MPAMTSWMACTVASRLRVSHLVLNRMCPVVAPNVVVAAERIRQAGLRERPAQTAAVRRNAGDVVQQLERTPIARGARHAWESRQHGDLRLRRQRNAPIVVSRSECADSETTGVGLPDTRSPFGSAPATFAHSDRHDARTGRARRRQPSRHRRGDGGRGTTPHRAALTRRELGVARIAELPRRRDARRALSRARRQSTAPPPAPPPPRPRPPPLGRDRPQRIESRSPRRVECAARARSR